MTKEERESRRIERYLHSHMMVNKEGKGDKLLFTLMH